MVEDKTFAIVMRAAAVLKIFQDAAVELKNFLEADAFHERPGLFTADAAGAKHHDGLLFQLRRQFGDGGGKIAEMIHADGQRVLERAELHFVIIARVEQRHGAAFVEPLLEFARGELGRRALRGIDAFDAERDDFFFQPHEHPRKRLVIRLAELGLQIFEAGQRSKFREEQVNFIAFARHKKIDALDAQENRAAQFPRAALREQVRAQRADVRQRGKLVGGEVGNFLHRNGSSV